LTNLIIPDGFLPFSDAVNRLAQGIWGGFRRPIPVQRLKQIYKKVFMRYGPWKEEAAHRLRAAAVKGRLPVYVFASLKGPSGDSHQKLVMIPENVLGQLITVRGSFPDHAIRPTTKTVCGDEALLVLLTKGLLLVRETYFDSWYKLDRARGRWPSQRSRLKQSGRPSVRTRAPEYRREVFAHRARRAADTLLNAKAERASSLTSADTAPALAPPNQTTPNQIPTDEITVVPTPSAASAVAPTSEQTSAQPSQSAPASDA
jgi:hypothetical protein